MVSLVVLTDAASQAASTTFSENFVDLAFQIVPKLPWAVGLLLLTHFGVDLASRFSRRLVRHTEPALPKFFVQIATVPYSRPWCCAEVWQ